MEQLLADENLYRIVLWHKDDECTLEIEMIDTDGQSSCSGGNEAPMSGTLGNNHGSGNASVIQDVQKWSSYVQRYVADGGGGGGVGGGGEVQSHDGKTRRKNNDPGASGGLGSAVKKAVFLQRNLKQWERRRRKDDVSKEPSAKESSGRFLINLNQ